MAAQGLKFGHCGGGQAGVLRCRVLGLERLHNRTSEAERKPEHAGTGITFHGCSREAPIAAEDFILRLGGWGVGRGPGEEAHTAFRLQVSRTHRVAGQKLNCNPTWAASHPLPQPGHRGGTGEKRTRMAGAGGTELPLPESCRRRRGQTRLPQPSERIAGKNPAWLLRRCALGRGTAACAPRCPFGGGQLPTAAAQPPGTPAPAAPGCASSAPGWQPGHP